LFNTREEAQNHIDAVVGQYGPQNETKSLKEGTKDIGYMENIIRSQTNDELKEMVKGLPVEKPRDWRTFLKIAVDEMKERNLTESKWPQAKCSKCGKTVDEIDLFPGKICLQCHSDKWDKVPLDKLPKPDFVKAIREALTEGFAPNFVDALKVIHDNDLTKLASILMVKKTPGYREAIELIKKEKDRRTQNTPVS
jgi:hypothetical protein